MAAGRLEEGSLNLNNRWEISTPVLGLVRETYNMWERRCALNPTHVQVFVQEGVRVLVQPSNCRIYPDSAYEEAGALVKEDLSEANIILGIKPVSTCDLLPNRAYFIFSHTIKAQAESMQMLDACVDRNISLFDYECIVNDDGKRVIGFGDFAGIVGTVDILQALGQRLLADGFATPFIAAPLAHMAPSLEKNILNVKELAERIQMQGFPEGMGPIVFAVTGTGNVGRGCRRILELLPTSVVAAEDLPALWSTPVPRHRETKIYCCYLEVHDLVRLTSQSNTASQSEFDKEHYYAHPQEYSAVFHERIAPFITVLINGIYWDNRYPRLLTTSQARDLPPALSELGQRTGTPSLRAIADISCDLNGSLEFCSRTTTFEQPYFEWDVRAQRESPKVGAAVGGIVVNTVDILPTALPQDATDYFGRTLSPILKDLFQSMKVNAPLPAQVERALICHQNRLTPAFEYISRFRETADLQDQPRQDSPEIDHPFSVVLFQGPLFESLFVNTAFALIRKRGVFRILDFVVVPRKGSTERESQMVLVVSAVEAGTLEVLGAELFDLGRKLGVHVQELDALRSTAQRLLLSSQGQRLVLV